MRVYHFLEKQWAIESLIYERIKVSLFDDMNDPFELLGVSLKKKADRIAFNKLKKEISEEMGAVCFSKSWNNPVQWSHYGERHKGLVLGFDIPAKHAHKINYEGERLQDNLENGFNVEDKKLGHKLLTTKYKHWKYEKEVRMMIDLDDANKNNGIYYLPYCDALILKEVIIGPRCDLTKRNILKICRNKDIKITKSRLAFKSYRVVRDKKVK